MHAEWHAHTVCAHFIILNAHFVKVRSCMWLVCRLLCYCFGWKLKAGAIKEAIKVIKIIP